jgi:hypothetical protein
MAVVAGGRWVSTPWPAYGRFMQHYARVVELKAWCRYPAVRETGAKSHYYYRLSKVGNMIMQQRIESLLADVRWEPPPCPPCPWAGLWGP